MTWPNVMLALGLVALSVIAYALRLWRSMHLSELYTKDARDRISALEMTLSDRTSRIAKIEHALRIDGARIMAAAAKDSIPGFMR